MNKILRLSAIAVFSIFYQPVVFCLKSHPAQRQLPHCRHETRILFGHAYERKTATGYSRYLGTIAFGRWIKAGVSRG